MADNNPSFGFLEGLWYVVPGAIVTLALFLILKTMFPLVFTKTITNPILFFICLIVGYLIHQIFRKMTFKEYSGNNYIHKFIDKMINETLKTDKAVEDKDIDRDAFYNYFFYSAKDLEHLYVPIKKKSFYAISVGTSSVACIFAGLISLIGLIVIITDCFCEENIRTNVMIIHSIFIGMSSILAIVLWKLYSEIDMNKQKQEEFIVQMKWKEKWFQFKKAKTNISHQNKTNKQADQK